MLSSSTKSRQGLQASKLLDSDDSSVAGSSEDLANGTRMGALPVPHSAAKLASSLFQAAGGSSSEDEQPIKLGHGSSKGSSLPDSGVASAKLAVAEAARAHAQERIHALKQQKGLPARPLSRQGPRASSGSDDPFHELRPATPPGSALPARTRGGQGAASAASIVADVPRAFDGTAALGLPTPNGGSMSARELDGSDELMMEDGASSVGARSSLAGNSARSIAIGAALLARRSASAAPSASRCAG